MDRELKKALSELHADVASTKTDVALTKQLLSEPTVGLSSQVKSIDTTLNEHIVSDTALNAAIASELKTTNAKIDSIHATREWIVKNWYVILLIVVAIVHGPNAATQVAKLVSGTQAAAQTHQVSH